MSYKPSRHLIESANGITSVSIPGTDYARSGDERQHDGISVSMGYLRSCSNQQLKNLAKQSDHPFILMLADRILNKN